MRLKMVLTAVCGLAWVASLLLLGGCSAPDEAERTAPETVGQRDPLFGHSVGRNVVFYNHADPVIDGAEVTDLLQRQYDFLHDLIGAGPLWVIVHTANDYGCGHTFTGGPWPEMFLMARPLLDTRVGYAHEMTHCFNAQFGELPHWFDESMADAMYFESEVQLYRRRQADELLSVFDRVDHRSYELMQLRTRFGPDYFRRVYAVLRARGDECRRLMAAGTPLEDRNRFLLAVLGEAASTDLMPLFTQEWGFDLGTRERQRGY